MNTDSVTNLEFLESSNHDRTAVLQQFEELEEIFCKVLTPWNYLVFYSRYHCDKESLDASDNGAVKRLKALLVAFETLQFQLITLLESTSNMAEMECNSDAVKFKNIAFEDINLQMNCNLMQLLDNNEINPTNQRQIKVTSSKEFQDEYDICQSALNVSIHSIVNHVSSRISLDSKNDLEPLPSDGLRRSKRQQRIDYKHYFIPSIIDPSTHDQKELSVLKTQKKSTNSSQSLKWKDRQNEHLPKIDGNIGRNYVQEKQNIKKLTLRKKQKIGLIVAKDGVAKANDYVKKNIGIDLPPKLATYFSKWYKKNYSFFCKSNRDKFIRKSATKIQKRETLMKDNYFGKDQNNNELEKEAPPDTPKELEPIPVAMEVGKIPEDQNFEKCKNLLPNTNPHIPCKTMYEPIASALRFVESPENQKEEQSNICPDVDTNRPFDIVYEPITSALKFVKNHQDQNEEPYSNLCVNISSEIEVPSNNKCLSLQDLSIEEQLRLLFGDDLENSFDNSDF